MRIGFLVNAIVGDGSICVYDICRRGEKAGHSIRLYGKGFKDNRDGVTTVEFSDGEIQTVEWWKRESLDAAFFYGTDGFDPSVLLAARAAGARVVIECDSDGYVSILQDALRVLRVKMWDSSYTLHHKAAIISVWLRYLLFKSAKHERKIFKAFELADYIKIESEGPANLLRGFLKRRGRGHLAEKVVTVYFAVRDVFVTEPVNLQREDLIIVAGRIGAQQKNPALLEKALRRFFDAPGSAHLEIHVRGEAPNLERWAISNPRIRLFKNTASQDLCKRLANSRVLVSTSRFESTPIQGLEALCQGCTLIASDGLPGSRSLIQSGAYGDTFKRNSADGCATAIRRELERWNTGMRDPKAIADHWRSQCSLEVVTSKLLALAEGNPSQ